VTGDVVVGAEGGLSPTVRALTDRALSADLGLTGIAGSVPRRAGVPVPSYLLHGPALAFAPDGVGMFLSLTSVSGASVPPDLAAAVGEPSLVWGLIAATERVPGAGERSPEELVAGAVGVLDGWNPWLTERILESDRSRVAAFAFRIADPDTDVTPWIPRRITALGDAVHAMPPTGGQAASTAIRDAGSLAAQLKRHLHGEQTLAAALAAYQSELGAWARPALRESAGPVRVIRALQHPLGQALGRGLLAVADRLPAWRG
jgi:salicylate hydroxylase